MRGRKKVRVGKIGILQEGKIAVAKGIDSGMHMQWLSVVARVYGNELCSFQESHPWGYINYFIP